MVVGAKCRPRIITGTVPTSTGTVDYTVSGEGTPVGGIIILSRVTSLGSITDACSFSWGAFDGTRERVVFGYDRDNLGTQDSASGGDDDGTIVRLYDNSASIEIEASWDSWVTDGVKIDWTTVSGTAYRFSILLYYGTDVECYAWDSIGAATPDTITTGFETDFTHTMQSRSIDGSTIAEMRFECGFAGRTSEKNACVGALSDDGRSTTEARRRASASDVARTIRLGTSDTLSGISFIDNWTSTGFDFNGEVSGIPGAGPRVAGLAVYAGGYNVYVEDDGDTGTSVATENLTDAGFRAGFVQMCYSAATGPSSFLNGAAAGWGMTDFTTERAISVTSRDNQSTSITTSYAEDALLTLIGAPGTSLLVEATENGKLDDGFSVSWDTVSGTARAYRYVVIEEPFSAEDGAGSFPIATGTGSGNLIFSGSGTPSLPLMEGDGAGLLRFIGSGDADLPLATGTGQGAQKFTGSGAGSFPLATGAGTGALAFSGTGAGTLPLVTGTGAGTLAFSGTGAGLLPLTTGTGSGALVFSGSGSALLPIATGTGSGLLQFTGSGAGNIPLAEGSGSGLLSFVGTGTALLPITTGTGAGLLRFIGSGAGVLPLTTGTGSGTVTVPVISGTGDGVLPLTTGSGTGVLSFIGSGAGLFPLVTGTGAGLLRFTGSGAGTLPLTTGSGTGALVFSGSGAGTLPLLTGAGAGLLRFIGSGSGVLPLMTGTGTGTVTLPIITGTGAAILPLMTGTGTGITGTQPVCASLLLGTYSPADALLGTYVPADTILGGLDQVTELLGSFTLSEELLGRYNNVTTLEGGIC